MIIEENKNRETISKTLDYKSGWPKLQLEFLPHHNFKVMLCLHYF